MPKSLTTRPGTGGKLFQLIEKRKTILKDVKEARKKDQLKKFKVDQNRGIGINHKKEDIKMIMK